jgi:hypothetical protein
MPAGKPDPGRNTALPTNVAYRVGRITPYLAGRWLDYGCAEGGYASALLSHGASAVVGVDVEPRRISEAQTSGSRSLIVVKSGVASRAGR